MKEVTVLILGREDLIERSNDIKASYIRISDFKEIAHNTMKLFAKQDMIIFVDTNGETRILKNRYGDEGKIIRKRKWNR